MTAFKDMDKPSKILIEGEGELFLFCPGCNCTHAINIKNSQRPCWGFNGDYERPTFEPSLLVTYPANPNAGEEYKEWRTERRCHSFIRNGQIQYLTDCTHHLAGQTIDIPEWDGE